MTQPAAAPPPIESSNAEKVIAALAALLAAGGALAAVKSLLGSLKGVGAALLGKFWVRRKLGKLATGAKVPKLGPNPTAPDIVRQQGAQGVVDARAAYLVRAVQRLGAAYITGDKDVIAKAAAIEDRYMAAHVKMAAQRKAATEAVAGMVKGRTPDAQGEVLLGWYLDDSAKNCARCVAADGKNFNALKRPPIGWPGWVHSSCFCKAGKPHATDERVEDVSNELRVSNLEFGRGSKLWKYWTGAKGFARCAGAAHPWTALRDALLSEGVPAKSADGLATNIMLATPAGRALYAKGHKGSGKKRSAAMTTETRVMEITEVRGAKAGEKPGFTARAVNYNVPDTYRTSWAPGVFKDALEQRSEMPVVWNHDWADPVGFVTGYRDSGGGLDIDVEFDDFEAVPRARQAHAQCKRMQMSFAFVRDEEQEDPQHRGVMLQTRAGLQEFSLVINGSVPGTKVTSTRTAEATIAPDAAAALLTRFAAGDIALADALVELRGAAPVEVRTATHEIRALAPDGTPASGVDPVAILSEVDAALVSLAESLDKGEVDEARQWFSAGANRLSELQYMLGCVPALATAGMYAWRSDAPVEIRTEQPAEVRNAEPDADVETALAAMNQRTARSYQSPMSFADMVRRGIS